MSPTVIRPFGASELQVVEPLWNALREHHLHVAPEHGPPRTRAESWARRKGMYARWFENPETFGVLALDETAATVGYAIVLVSDGSPSRDTGRAASLETLSILPSARRTGVGSQILEEVRAQLRARSIGVLQTTALQPNESALAFYARQGFAPLSITLQQRVE